MPIAPKLRPLLQALKARFTPPLQHSFTEEQVKQRAQTIYQERTAKGQSGTAEGDWQQAIRSLLAEQRISAKAHQLWEARQLKLRESDKRTAVDDWRDAESRLKESWVTQFVRWTGIREKKGWDFVQLLASISIPVVLFAGGSFFTYWNNQQQQKLAETRQQDEVLKNYFDSMKGLLLDKDHPLRQSKAGDESRSIARTLTLTALRLLDSKTGERKGLLLQFLYESGLIKSDKERASVIELSGANLSGANLWYSDLTSASLYRVNLKGADLSFAHLSGANLWFANLTSANLWNTDLSGANLWFADLTSADLNGANLNGANLTEANLSGVDLRKAQGLTDKQLESAILCRTTLLDGTVSNRNCEAVGIKP